MAMVALGVIGLYTLLTFWIITIETIHRNDKDGSLGFRDHPIFGFLLPEATQRRVGPAETPGFGRKLKPEQQAEKDRHWFNELRTAMDALGRIPEDERAVRAEAVLADMNAGRPLAPMAIDDLTARFESFRTDFSNYDILLSRQGLLLDAVRTAESIPLLMTQIERAEEVYADVVDDLVAFEEGDEYLGVIERAEEAARAFDSAQRAIDQAPDDRTDQTRQAQADVIAQARAERNLAEAALREIENREDVMGWRQSRRTVQNLRETLGFELQRIEDRIRTFVDEIAMLGGDAGGLDELDVSMLFDIGDALVFAAEDPDTPLAEALANEGIDGDPVPEALLAQIIELAEKLDPKLDADILAAQTKIRPYVNEFFPMPVGLEGFMYRLKVLFGTDVQGRSILVRAIYAGKIAMQIGFVTGLVAVIFGSLLGAAAAFFGGWVDTIVSWLFSTLSSIPSLVLLIVLSFMFRGTAVEGTLLTVYIAFCVTFWIGPCRVIRGETMKIKELEYVQAATAIGFGRLYILLKHIIPNTSHLMFINFSLLFIGAVKSEVILSFLGLGLRPGQGASWGIMINQSSSQVINGFFWQIGAATLFMFILVLAFNILTDALQDAFDPKHVG